MFNSFRKSLGNLPVKESVLGEFEFTSTLEIINGATKIIECNYAPIKVTHKIFNDFQELEVALSNSDTKMNYLITKLPYKNNGGAFVFEAINKKKNDDKLIMLLSEDGEYFEMRGIGISKKNWVFTEVDLYKQQLLLEIDQHFKKYMSEKKFMLELEISIEDFLYMWQILAIDEIPKLTMLHNLDRELLSRTVKNYRLNFLIGYSEHLIKSKNVK